MRSWSLLLHCQPRTAGWSLPIQKLWDSPVWWGVFWLSRVCWWGWKECLWIRIMGKKEEVFMSRISKANILEGVCYWPANQAEEADRIFPKQLGEDSQLLVFAFMGVLNLPDVCWKYNTVERKQVPGVCGRELPDTAGEWPSQGITGPAVWEQRRTGGLWGGWRTWHNNHKMIEFSVLEGVRCESTELLPWIWRTDFGLFRSLVNKVPWETVLKGRGVQEGWTFSRKEVLKAQEQTVPMYWKITQQEEPQPIWTEGFDWNLG